MLAKGHLPCAPCSGGLSHIVARHANQEGKRGREREGQQHRNQVLLAGCLPKRAIPDRASCHLVAPLVQDSGFAVDIELGLHWGH